MDNDVASYKHSLCVSPGVCRGSLMSRPTRTSPLQRLRAALLADTPRPSASERRYSALAAMLGIGITIGLLGAFPQHYWLLAPMGASAIILFGMSHSPVAQPWPVIGGYLFSVCAGLVSAALFGPAWIAAGAAVAVSLWLMARLNCIHPPGGALALLIVLDQKTYASSASQTLALVAANVTLLLLSAAIINNLIPGRRYPHRAAAEPRGDHGTRDAAPLLRSDLQHDDLVSAIRAMDTFVDVGEDDLVRLYNLAIDHAFSRHVGLRCEDVMSRDVVTTSANATLTDAWHRMQEHRIKALPVVDEGSRLIGIVTLSDLFGYLGSAPSIEQGAAGWQDRRVSDVMTVRVRTAGPSTPMAELVREVAQTGRHHIPVTDATGRLVGILTQSDMIAALYRRLALESGESHG